MRKKNKIALTIILIAIVAGVISLVLIKRNRSTSDCNNGTTSSNGECKVDLGSVQSSSTTSPTVSTSSTSSAVSGYLYQNDQYGFELTFNSAWKGYAVSQRSQDKAEVIYDFTMPTKDKNFFSGVAVPLTIEVFAKEGYSPDSTLTKIAESNKYVFVYSIWTEAPSDSSITEKDISKVISTFKLK